MIVEVPFAYSVWGLVANAKKPARSLDAAWLPVDVPEISANDAPVVATCTYADGRPDATNRRLVSARPSWITTEYRSVGGALLRRLELDSLTCIGDLQAVPRSAVDDRRIFDRLLALADQASGGVTSITPENVGLLGDIVFWRLPTGGAQAYRFRSDYRGSPNGAAGFISPFERGNPARPPSHVPPTKPAAIFRHIVRDDRDVRMAAVRDSMRRSAFINGELFVPSMGPCWTINSLGLQVAVPEAAHDADWSNILGPAEDAEVREWITGMDRRFAIGPEGGIDIMDRSFEFPDPWEFRLRDIALQMARWLSSKIPDFDCPGLAMDWAAFAGAVSSEHSVASEIADTVDVWLARGLDFNDPWRNRTTDNLPQTMAMYRRHGMRVADALLPQP